MRVRNPIVIVALIGLAIILGVAGYTFLRPEPRPVIMSATYGYYHLDTRTGQLEIQCVGHSSYTFDARFSVSTTAGRVEADFDGRVEGLRNALQRSMSIRGGYRDSRLPLPTAIDAAIFTEIAKELTFELLPERWGAIRDGYSGRFTYRIPLGGIRKLAVPIAAVAREDVEVPSGTFIDTYVVTGTEPDMDLEITLWVTDQGIVAQAEITMAVRGIDPLTLTLKLERMDSNASSLP